MARDIRILVIGKANLMRDGLWALLRAQDGMEVLEPLDNDVEVIKSAGVKPMPDTVLVLSLVMTPNALGVIAAARGRWPAAHAVVLTLRLDDRVITAVTQAGGAACIWVGDSHTELLSAIRMLSRGDRYLRSSTTSDTFTGPDELTDREKEVMRLIATGYRTREIADRLSLSRKTIEKHRANLMRKLGLRSATAVAAYAIAHGHLMF